MRRAARGRRVLGALLATGAALACGDPRRAAPAAGRTAHSAGVVAPPDLAAFTSDSAVREDTLRFGDFGVVHLLRGAPDPPHVLVFASGDGGWDATARRLARQLAATNALVVGIDSRAYFPRLMRAQRCAYPAGDVEALSQYVQHRLGRARYVPPVLVGHSSGSALAYATLAQAPVGTFAGAVTLGLCPGFLSARPFCAGPARVPLGARRKKGIELLPDASLRQPVVVLHPQHDDECGRAAAERFARVAPGARVVPVPGGHLFERRDDWLPALREALAGLDAARRPARVVAATVADLPLIEVPARGAAAPGAGDLLAVIVSGDGGWASLDRQVGDAFAARGIPVVGLDALQYFWTRRTPDEAGRALQRLVAHYRAAWRRDRVLLVGYSRGADVLPFMATRLADDQRGAVAGVALLGLEPSVAFEFHVSDWLGGAGPPGFAVVPEVARLRAALPGVPLLCLYGTDEDDSACPAAARVGATAVAFPGGHHLGGDYPALAARILAAVGARGGGPDQ